MQLVLDVVRVVVVVVGVLEVGVSVAVPVGPVPSCSPAQLCFCVLHRTVRSYSDALRPGKVENNCLVVDLKGCAPRQMYMLSAHNRNGHITQK